MELAEIKKKLKGVAKIEGTLVVCGVELYKTSLFNATLETYVFEGHLTKENLIKLIPNK